jgi:hypothetical protein
MMNIDYPFHFDRRGRTALTGDLDHIRDLIEQLLFTRRGERVNRPDFGSGLYHMVFEPNSPEIAAALRVNIAADLERYLGDLIVVEALDVQAEEATLRVDLRYVVRRTGEQLEASFLP